MENKREHSTNHATPKTPKEIIVNSLTELFADDEFGFDMFIMMKTGDPPMKHFAFYVDPLAGNMILSSKSKTPSSRVSEICFLMRRLNMQWQKRQGAIKIFFTS